MNTATRKMLECGAADFGLQLSPEQVEKLVLYAEELKKWNRKINLTAINSDEDIVIKHFVDSLALAKFVKADAMLVDIGSGAGFPCIPLKIIMPALRVTSVDAVEKKIIFQRNVARLIGLAGFEAVHGRAEQLQPDNKADAVVSRAFSDILTFAGMAKRLMKPEGMIIAMKGKEGREEAEHAKVKLEQMGLTVSAVEEFRLPSSGDARSLVFIRSKTG
ncbi:16S rRNA (guanine(527)-N(7))-methyltransferase RsmG [Geotalea toluenoxydans]|uniref:16S rRNA (guanine(527)-N(7))-methyltransferase RsmG n=1 Tax=Geotalea toluenoxydans TaxID=421624 RepID=UPI000A8EBF2C